MEEVKKVKRQEDIKSEDLKDIDIEELIPGFNLEELTDVIENVFGVLSNVKLSLLIKRL